MSDINLMHGDCLELMKSIPDNSIDLVLTDPPYGTTKCKWDTVIDFNLMWKELNRVIKENGAICLFSKQPFTSKLIMSNIKKYKYDWYWKKNRPANINCGNIRPMDYIEIISVFHSKKTTYNKQMIQREGSGRKRQEYSKRTGETRIIKTSIHNSGSLDFYNQRSHEYDVDLKNPMNLLFFNRVNRTVHPTEKPVDLLEYFIKTYANKNESVLDFTMGSGSTGVAAINLNRKFIGIELDDKYFEVAENRIADAIEERAAILRSKSNE